MPKTEIEIKNILTQLALNAGNMSKTASDLGVGVDTVRRYKTERAKEYERLRDEIATQLEAEAVRNLRDRMAQANEAEELAIKRTIEVLSATNIRTDLPHQAAVAMARVKATNAEKLLALTGRPTEIIDDRSATKILESLERRKVIRLVHKNEEATG